MRRNNFKSSAKLDALMRHLNRDRKADPGTKAVVFSQFTGMLDLAGSILNRDGFQFLRLDGTLSQASREQTLKAFKDPDHPATVMLISLRAGGVGLNLTAASRVYMLVSFPLFLLFLFLFCFVLHICSYDNVFVMQKCSPKEKPSNLAFITLRIRGGTMRLNHRPLTEYIELARRNL